MDMLYCTREYYAPDSTKRKNICAPADGYVSKSYNKSIKFNAALFHWCRFSASLSERLGVRSTATEISVKALQVQRLLPFI